MKSKPIWVDEKIVRRMFAVFSARAAMGQEFVILRNGQPYSRLVSHRMLPRRER
jgi:hypothetical protein